MEDIFMKWRVVVLHHWYSFWLAWPTNVELYEIIEQFQRKVTQTKTFSTPNTTTQTLKTLGFKLWAKIIHKGNLKSTILFKLQHLLISNHSLANTTIYLLLIYMFITVLVKGFFFTVSKSCEWWNSFGW